MSLNLLTTQNFYTYAGFTSADVNSSYVTFLIDSMNDAVDEALEGIFTLNTFTKKYYASRSRQNIPIEAWQPPGAIYTATITNAGSGYTTAPTLTVTDSTGSGAVLTATVSGGQITAVTVVKQGNGYTSPTVSVTGGGGASGAVTASVATLTIKKGHDSTATLETLALGSEYRLIAVEEEMPNKTIPIGMVALYFAIAPTAEYISVQGVFGYGPSIPKSLQLEAKLYDLIKSAVQYADSQTSNGGSGDIVSTTIDRVSVTYGKDGDNGIKHTTQQVIHETNTLLQAIADQYLGNNSYLASIIG